MSGIKLLLVAQCHLHRRHPLPLLEEGRVSPSIIRSRYTQKHLVLSCDGLSCDSSYDSSCDRSVDGSEGDAEQAELAYHLPVWDSVNGCLMMKFLRLLVRLVSSKNVVMYRADDLMQEEDSSGVDQDNAVYQFGKTRVENDRKSVFVLDFRNPVAPLQAFAIALSGFAFKSKNE
eukprot:FR735684.1.p1 GENE.FR735684.1~~FR735684.1.p1  ORF type:complete len:174 (+),score=15.21 FR735684.1:226-747(+)